MCYRALFYVFLFYFCFLVFKEKLIIKEKNTFLLSLNLTEIHKRLEIFACRSSVKTELLLFINITFYYFVLLNQIFCIHKRVLTYFESYIDIPNIQSLLHFASFFSRSLCVAELKSVRYHSMVTDSKFYMIECHQNLDVFENEMSNLIIDACCCIFRIPIVIISSEGDMNVYVQFPCQTKVLARPIYLAYTTGVSCHYDNTIINLEVPTATSEGKYD